MEHHFFQVQFWHHITKCTDCCFSLNSSELYCSHFIPLVNYKSSILFMSVTWVRKCHEHDKKWPQSQISESFMVYDDTADLCRTSIFDFPLYIIIYLYHLFLYKDEKENRKLWNFFCCLYNWHQYCVRDYVYHVMSRRLYQVIYKYLSSFCTSFCTHSLNHVLQVSCH